MSNNDYTEEDIQEAYAEKAEELGNKRKMRELVKICT